MKRVFPVFAAVAVCLAAAALLQAQSGPDGKGADAVKQGRALYSRHCVSCHGTAGEGDGPAASSLKAPTPDLTKISRRHNGFPAEKMADFISGEKYALGHGSREMPVWGKQFRKAGGTGNPGEIVALTRYLESIQKK